ncbi:hypothetical protein BDV09DRAFT_200986, partial [Aspergillus tetrazonus]
MQLLKVLLAPLFATLVASAPLAAPQISVDYGQSEQFAQDIQSFADSTSSQFSQVSAQFDVLTGSYSGSAQESLAQLFAKLSDSVYDIQRVSTDIASTIDATASAYEDAESSAIGTFFSKRDKLRARDDAAAMAEAGLMKEAGFMNEAGLMNKVDDSIAPVSGSQTAEDAVAEMAEVDGVDDADTMSIVPTAAPSTGSVTPEQATGSGAEGVTPEQATGSGAESITPEQAT